MLKCLIFLLVSALLVLLFITRWERMKLGFKVFGIFWLSMAAIYLIQNGVSQQRLITIGLVAAASAVVYGIAWVFFNVILARRMQAAEKKAKR